MVTEKKLTAVSFAALICTVLVLLGYCAAFSVEAEDARAEAAILRMQSAARYHQGAARAYPVPATV